MFLVGLAQVQIGMARALRAAFQHHHQFRWDPNEATTKITIYDEFPLARRSYPNIIVGSNSGEFLRGHRGIGDEFADYETTPISVNGCSYSQVTTEIKSGTNRLLLSLNCEARSRSEVLQIADWAVLFIRSFAVEKFQREGLWVEDIQAGQVNAQLVGSDPVHSVTISVTCLTEFSRTIPIAVSQTLNALCLIGIFTSLPDGTTYGDSVS